MLVLAIDFDHDIQVGDCLIGLRMIKNTQVKLAFEAPLSVNIKRIKREESPMRGVPLEERKSSWPRRLPS